MTFRMVLALLILLTGLGIGTVDHAYAQDSINVATEYNLFTYDTGSLNDAMIHGRKHLCRPADFDGVIFGKIVNCLAQPHTSSSGMPQKPGVIVAITNILMDRVEPYFSGAVFALCALMIALYGVKLSTAGVSNIPGETMALVFKLAVVIVVTTQMSEFYNMLVSLMFGMTEMTFNALSGSAQMCPDFARSMLEEAGLHIGTDIWSEWDCLFGLMFFGGGAAVGLGIIVAIVAMLFVTLGTGLIVFLFFLGIAVMLLKIAMMGIQTFLLAFLNMTFLMLLAPIFVVQIFFKSRKDSFDKWLTMLMEAIITPAILIAALSVMMAILKTVFVYGFLVTTFGIGLDSLPNFMASAARLGTTTTSSEIASTTNYSDPAQASTEHTSREGSSTLPQNLTRICSNEGASHPEWCAPCGGDASTGYCPLNEVTAEQGGQTRGMMLCTGDSPDPAVCEPCPNNPGAWCPKTDDPSVYTQGIKTTVIDAKALATTAGADDEEGWGYGSFISGIITLAILFSTSAILKRIPEVAGGLASTGVNFAASAVPGEKMFDRAKGLIEEGAKAYASGGASAAAKAGESGLKTMMRGGLGGGAGDIAANVINQLGRRR